LTCYLKLINKNKVPAKHSHDLFKIYFIIFFTLKISLEIKTIFITQKLNENRYVLCFSRFLSDSTGKLLGTRSSGFHISDILELHDPAASPVVPKSEPDLHATPHHGKFNFILKQLFHIKYMLIYQNAYCFIYTWKNIKIQKL
jgi:hypothetical protein